jgi:hypothetical protein
VHNNTVPHVRHANLLPTLPASVRIGRSTDTARPARIGCSQQLSTPDPARATSTTSLHPSQMYHPPNWLAIPNRAIDRKPGQSVGRSAG